MVIVTELVLLHHGVQTGETAVGRRIPPQVKLPWAVVLIDVLVFQKDVPHDKGFLLWANEFLQDKGLHCAVCYPRQVPFL